MNFSRYNFLGLLGGIALLILPIFFDENFNGGWFEIGVYILMVTFGISILIYFLSKLLGFKPIYLFIAIVLLELGIFFSFFPIKNNQITSPSIIKQYQNFYLGYLRNIPSYQIGLAEYDSDLFYRLRPGHSINKNIEFSNTYKINSQGIRDDESSLDFPEIIMLGDSHTMGWGVEQDETFANLLEEKTGKKVLNTGIASYGSAREYLMFQRLKTDSCSTIIWQYCSNDNIENNLFLENGNHLEISSETEYNYSCRRNFLNATYYPFKYCFEVFGHQIRKNIRRDKFTNTPKTELPQEVSNFFEIVKLLQEDYKGDLIIFNLESNQTTDEFYRLFKEYVEENNVQKIKLIDFSKILNEEDYFIIDDHINVSGHQKVSEAIFRKMQNKSKSMNQNGI